MAVLRLWVSICLNELPKSASFLLARIALGVWEAPMLGFTKWALVISGMLPFFVVDGFFLVCGILAGSWSRVSCCAVMLRFFESYDMG